jgi:DNA-binding transcriptional regulator YdaS (Cro superfamily)
MKRKAMKKMSNPDPGILSLRQSRKIGKLAKKLGISRQAIYQWEKVPAERVPEVARITGVSRHILRRDLYDSVRKRIS